MRCDDTLGFIITSAAFGTGAHCFKSRPLTYCDHLPLCHCGPFVHGDFVVLKLSVAVQQHLLWFGAQTKCVTFPCNMLVSSNTVTTAHLATFSRRPEFEAVVMYRLPQLLLLLPILHVHKQSFQSATFRSISIAQSCGKRMPENMPCGSKSLQDKCNISIMPLTSSHKESE